MERAIKVFHKLSFPVFQAAQLWLNSSDLLDIHPFLISSPVVAQVLLCGYSFFNTCPRRRPGIFFFLPPHTIFSCCHSCAHFSLKVSPMPIVFSNMPIPLFNLQFPTLLPSLLPLSVTSGSQSLTLLLYFFMARTFHLLDTKNFDEYKLFFENMFFPCNYIVRFIAYIDQQ